MKPRKLQEAIIAVMRDGKSRNPAQITIAVQSLTNQVVSGSIRGQLHTLVHAKVLTRSSNHTDFVVSYRLASLSIWSRADKVWRRIFRQTRFRLTMVNGSWVVV